MKIALLTTHAYPATKAGTEIYVHELANALLEIGITPTVITFDSHSEWSSLPYAVESIGQGKSLIEVISEIQPDVVHFHSLHDGGFSLLNIMEVREAGFLVFVTFHLANNTCITNDLWKHRESQCDGVMSSSECASCYLQKRLRYKALALGVMKIQNSLTTLLDRNLNSPIQLTTWKIQKHHQLVRLALSRANHIVCLADWYKMVLLRNEIPSEKISCIPQLRPKNEAWPKRTNTRIKNILFIGRLEEEKGVYDLLNTWRRAGTKNLHLTLIGRATEPRTEMKLSRKYKGLSNLTFLGALPHEQTLIEMSNHHALILGSRFSEMSPLVIGEAISAGLVLIGSDSPGVKEACEKGSHVIFRRGNTKELEKIFKKLDCDNLRFNEPLIEFDSWTADAMAQWHCGVYSSAIGK